MTRLVKSRNYTMSVGYIPDEFSLILKGNEKSSILSYTEVYRQSKPYFESTVRHTVEKMTAAGWTVNHGYEEDSGTIDAEYKGTRKDCLGKIFLEMTFQAKCYHDDEDLREAFSDIDVRDTWEEEL